MLSYTTSTNVGVITSNCIRTVIRDSDSVAVASVSCYYRPFHLTPVTPVVTLPPHALLAISRPVSILAFTITHPCARPHHPLTLLLLTLPPFHPLPSHAPPPFPRLRARQPFPSRSVVDFGRLQLAIFSQRSGFDFVKILADDTTSF